MEDWSAGSSWCQHLAPHSTSSIKPGTSISAICNAPAPSDLPKCAPALTLPALIQAYDAALVMDGFSSPGDRLATAGGAWAGN